MFLKKNQQISMKYIDILPKFGSWQFYEVL